MNSQDDVRRPSGHRISTGDSSFGRAVPLPPLSSAGEANSKPVPAQGMTGAR